MRLCYPLSGLSINGLSVSEREKGLTKNVDSSITLISATKFGHSPISSLRLNASLYFRINFINLDFSFLFSAEYLRSIFSYKISASVWCLLGSSSASQGYLSGLSLVLWADFEYSFLESVLDILRFHQYVLWVLF